MPSTVSETEVCKVCRRSIGPNNRAVMGAFGTAWFVVHADPCAQVVQSGAAIVGRVALAGVNAALRARAPRAFAALEGVRTVVRRLNDGTEQQHPDQT